MPLSFSPAGSMVSIKAIKGKDESKRFLESLGFVEGERDIIGLDDDDLKCLGALISAVSGGVVKWESEAQ